MSDSKGLNTIQKLRVLLQRLEDSPAYDPSNTAFVKRFIRSRIRALEAAQSPAPEPKGSKRGVRSNTSPSPKSDFPLTVTFGGTHPPL
jgi:hypothetical protein